MRQPLAFCQEIECRVDVPRGIFLLTMPNHRVVAVNLERCTKSDSQRAYATGVMEKFAERLAKFFRLVSHRSLITCHRDSLETSFARPNRRTDAKSVCETVPNHKARLCWPFLICGHAHRLSDWGQIREGDTPAELLSRCVYPIRRLCSSFPSRTWPSVIKHGCFGSNVRGRKPNCPPTGCTPRTFCLAGTSLSGSRVCCRMWPVGQRGGELREARRTSVTVI